MVCESSKCQKTPSQLAFVSSMAISQQDRMPSFWFLGRGKVPGILITDALPIFSGALANSRAC